MCQLLGRYFDEIVSPELQLFHQFSNRLKPEVAFVMNCQLGNLLDWEFG